MLPNENKLFKRYEIINPYIFSNKFNFKKRLKKIVKLVWFEFLYKAIKVDKILSSEIKNFIIFSDYLKKMTKIQNTEKHLSFEKLTKDIILKLPENFIVVCIDEYINGRKQGSYFFNNNKIWADRSWKKLEEIFEIITFHLKFLKKKIY